MHKMHIGKGILFSFLFTGCLLMSGCASADASVSSSRDLSVPVHTEEPAENRETPEPVEKPVGSVHLSFDFTRAGTPASNQFAIWIEDENGNLVKTVYVSRFTGTGGYAKRKEALPVWAAKADPASMKAEDLDSMTGATPPEGQPQFVWDGTDANGNPVKSGTYTICLEGTLYWTSDVVFKGSFDTDKGSQEITMNGEYTEPDNAQNSDMITNVKASYQSSDR